MPEMAATKKCSSFTFKASASAKERDLGLRPAAQMPQRPSLPTSRERGPD